MSQHALPGLAVAVDCVPFQPGSEAAAHHRAIAGLLAEADRQSGGRLGFVYLTHSATHAAVRRLARPQDLLICVEEDPASPLSRLQSNAPLEFKLTSFRKPFLERIGIDVLYCPFGSRAVEAGELPVIVCLPDLLHREYPFALNSKQIAARELAMAQTLQSAAAIQAGSRDALERLISHYALAEGKLFYTYSPLPASPQAATPGARPFFLAPTGLGKQHNHETLLLAFRLYRERAGTGAWDLVLGGGEDEPRRAELVELTRALGIESAVHFAEGGLESEWQKAGALIHPSLHDLSGHALFEALAHGVPILTSPDGALGEIAGEACLGFDPRKPFSIAEALLKTSSDRVFRDSLIQLGRQRFEGFNLGLEARKWLDRIADCIPAIHNELPGKLECC